MREILLDRNYRKRKVTWEAVNSCSPRHTYLLPIFKKTLFKCWGGEAVLYSSSSSLLSMLAVQPAPVHPWKHQVKKATCHRGTSLQSQTGVPISPPRNCGPQSCYLLLLGQVLKELCRRPLQPMLHVLRSSDVWYMEQGGGQGKLYVWVDICSPEAGWDLLQRFVL